jgi:hypothetical protein
MKKIAFCFNLQLRLDILIAVHPPGFIATLRLKLAVNRRDRNIFFTNLEREGTL